MRYRNGSAPGEAEGVQTESFREFAKEYKRIRPKSRIGALEVSLLVRSASSACLNAFNRWLVSSGIGSGARYTLLRNVYFGGGRMTQNELARLLDVTSGNVTYLVDGLERDGLVERQSDANDRRFTWVQLTERGRQTCAELVPSAAQYSDELCDGFSDAELELLIALLQRLRNRAAALGDSTEVLIGAKNP